MLSLLEYFLVCRLSCLNCNLMELQWIILEICNQFLKFQESWFLLVACSVHRLLGESNK